MAKQVLCWNQLRQIIIWHAEHKLSGKMSVDDLTAVDQDVYRFLAHKTQTGHENDRDNTFEKAFHWNTPWDWNREITLPVALSWKQKGSPMLRMG